MTKARQKNVYSRCAKNHIAADYAPSAKVTERVLKRNRIGEAASFCFLATYDSRAAGYPFPQMGGYQRAREELKLHICRCVVDCERRVYECVGLPKFDLCHTLNRDVHAPCPWPWPRSDAYYLTWFIMHHLYRESVFVLFRWSCHRGVRCTPLYYDCPMIVLTWPYTTKRYCRPRSGAKNVWFMTWAAHLLWLWG